MWELGALLALKSSRQSTLRKSIDSNLNCALSFVKAGPAFAFSSSHVSEIDFIYDLLCSFDSGVALTRAPLLISRLFASLYLHMFYFTSIFQCPLHFPITSLAVVCTCFSFHFFAVTTALFLPSMSSCSSKAVFCRLNKMANYACVYAHMKCAGGLYVQAPNTNHTM